MCTHLKGKICDRLADEDVLPDEDDDNDDDDDDDGEWKRMKRMLMRMCCLASNQVIEGVAGGRESGRKLKTVPRDDH